MIVGQGGFTLMGGIDSGDTEIHIPTSVILSFMRDRCYYQPVRDEMVPAWLESKKYRPKGEIFIS